MYINKLYKNAKTCKKSTSTIVKKKNGQKVAFMQLVPKIKVLKLRIGADWCRVRTLHADVNQMVLLGVSLPPLLLYQRQLLQIKSEIYAYSPEEVWIILSTSAASD